jgi:hypothetical protein
MKLSVIFTLLILSLSTASSLTLDEIKAERNLTPDRFAKLFSDFQFKLSEEVQPPAVFLASKCGDCDDYATLAADVLAEKGYTTKLVVVFMPKSIHVVCYVAETKCYLDFNHRRSANPMTPSDGTLEDIANKVSGSFKASWHCVSEFVYQNGARKFIYTDFPQAKPPVTTSVFAQNSSTNSVAAPPSVSSVPVVTPTPTP